MLFSSSANAVDFKGIFESQSGKKIKVTSKSLAVKNNDNIAIFYEDVVVTQGKMTLKSGEIKIHTEEMSDKQKRFKIIEAMDGVSFSAFGKFAKADSAIYVIDDHLVTLSGNVSLKEKGNWIKGDNFTYNVKNGKTSIKSNQDDSSDKALGEVESKGKKARVKAVIIPDEDSLEGVDVPSLPPVNILKGKGKDSKSERGKH